MLNKKVVRIVPVVPNVPCVPNASRTIRTFTSFRTGFTLIEVLIAAAIFVIFAGSIIALFSLNSKNVVVNKHRLEATNLAREGIELVTQIKQTASARGQDWTGGCWKIDVGTKILVKDNSNPVCDPNTWRLIDGANDSIALPDTIPYTRVINIGDESGAKKITVTVSWSDYGIDREATEVTYLTKWQ